MCDKTTVVLVSITNYCGYIYICISSVVENFENIVLDIVNNHCFVEPSNIQNGKSQKLIRKDVVLKGENIKRKYSANKHAE